MPTSCAGPMAEKLQSSLFDTSPPLHESHDSFLLAVPSPIPSAPLCRAQSTHRPSDLAADKEIDDHALGCCSNPTTTSFRWSGVKLPLVEPKPRVGHGTLHSELDDSANENARQGQRLEIALASRPLEMHTFRTSAKKHAPATSRQWCQRVWGAPSSIRAAGQRSRCIPWGRTSAEHTDSVDSLGEPGPRAPICHKLINTFSKARDPHPHPSRHLHPGWCSRGG